MAAIDPVPCLVCGRELKSVFRGVAENQPERATTFLARGQYGSTLFDPGDERQRLEINVCDPCLNARCDRVYHVRSAAVQITTDDTYTEWDPSQ